VGRLDDNEREITDLLNGAVAKAKAQRWLTSYEDFYLGQMLRAWSDYGTRTVVWCVESIVFAS
jgi:hypothetical protein